MRRNAASMGRKNFLFLVKSYLDLFLTKTVYPVLTKKERTRQKGIKKAARKQLENNDNAHVTALCFLSGTLLPDRCWKKKVAKKKYKIKNSSKFPAKTGHPEYPE